MSKVFKNVTGDKKFHLHGLGDAVNLFISGSTTSFNLSSSTAPALALAILEAAGYTDDQKSWRESPEELFAQAMRCLRHGIEALAKATAEAKEREQLEAEALALLNSGLGTTFKTWIEAVRTNQPSVPNWLAVATKARELAKEAGE